MKISISLAQMKIKNGSLDHNLENALQMVSEAAELKSDIILLPELWSSSYDLEKSVKYAQKNSKIITELSKIAKSKNIAIGGSLLREFEGDIFNTFTMLNANGEILALYDKIHLFRLMNEHIWMKPGDKTQIVDFPWGKAGLAICYDLRFPEIFRKYAHSGAKLILLVAEWPQIRINHWKTLLQARAIENQIFVAAVNCVGQTGFTIYGGNSIIIDPWGKILVEGDLNYPRVLTSEIDLTLVNNVRKKIPVLDDCRPDIYYPDQHNI